jgi:hypothetical protein
LRSKRSAKPAASRLEAPALKAYAETISPNRCGEMSRSGMMIAPSGEMIMKSRMMENCRKASSATRNIW